MVSRSSCGLEDREDGLTHRILSIRASVSKETGAGRRSDLADGRMIVARQPMKP